MTMRLSNVEGGHTLAVRAKFAMIRLMMGAPAPGVMRTLAYRPEFFGGTFRKLTQLVMRGPSAWTVGERELFAAFVSQANRCRF